MKVFRIACIVLCVTVNLCAVPIAQQPALDEQMLREMLANPGIAKVIPELADMDKTQKEALIQQTLVLDEQIRQQPPEQQAQLEQMIVEKATQRYPKLLQEDIFEPQAQQPQQQQAPVFQPQQIQQDFEQTTKPAKEIDKKSVDKARAMITGLSAAIDEIEISFSLLTPRISDNPYVYGAWEDVQQYLPQFVALIKNMHGNDMLLGKLATGSSTLYHDLERMKTGLEQQRTHLKIADVPGLRRLSADEASRAGVITSGEKKRSQQAVADIVKTFSSTIHASVFGTRKLFEDYAAEELKRIEKQHPISKPQQPRGKPVTFSGSTGSGRAPAYKDSGYPSYWPSSDYGHYKPGTLAGESAQPGKPAASRGGAGSPGSVKDAKKAADADQKEKKDKSLKATNLPHAEQKKLKRFETVLGETEKFFADDTKVAKVNDTCVSLSEALADLASNSAHLAQYNQDSLIQAIKNGNNKLLQIEHHLGGIIQTVKERAEKDPKWLETNIFADCFAQHASVTRAINNAKTFVMVHEDSTHQAVVAAAALAGTGKNIEWALKPAQAKKEIAAISRSVDTVASAELAKLQLLETSRVAAEGNLGITSSNRLAPDLLEQISAKLATVAPMEAIEDSPSEMVLAS